ncbi:PREDICTED: uncharacterized protein LOC108379074 [Rhagoletis zephyria]|uniref:uncharacterized protein LOC108379074 n=1 Tax=Rhagoletis zephyria TaxID=28612 RepID=UPI00081125AC|nr:PREDICTED: uncharacterized protein LOC108379074 [Rhagoletis zephyria]
MRKAIPLEKRVAIALYALGSSAEYRSIANLFGVGKSTVGSEKINEYVKGFEILGFPQCLGAIDGCHIEIHPSTEDAIDYHNYKGWYSTVLLALVDARCRFIYINVGAPGRCNDSQIYEKSTLKQQLQECRLLNDMTKKNLERQHSYCYYR